MQCIGGIIKDHGAWRIVSDGINEFFGNYLRVRGEYANAVQNFHPTIRL